MPSGRRIRPLRDRLIDRLEKQPNGCIVFRGFRDSSGYGTLSRPGGGRVAVHRLSYETFVGPIPEGMCIDHLCFNKMCCNVLHLEAVTLEENTRRAWRAGLMRPPFGSVFHCKRGHAFDEKNTRYRPNGGRTCRACENDRIKRRYGALKIGTATNGTNTASPADSYAPRKAQDDLLSSAGEGRAVPTYPYNSDGSGSPWTVERRSRREVSV